MCETVLMIALQRAVQEAAVVRDQLQFALDRLPDGRKARPVFQLIVARYLDPQYSPDAVSERCGIPAATIATMVQEETVAAATAASGSTLIDTASALELTGSDMDYSTFSKNAGLYLSDTEDLGVSDDLTTLAQTDDEMNNTLLAAV